MKIDLDCYASETSWELKNDDGLVVFKSNAYSNADDGVHTYDFCLTEDCYTFTLFDSYGDGMVGCTTGNGSFQITNASSTVLAEMTTSQANFTDSLVRTFCLGELSLDQVTNSFDVFPNPTTGMVTWNSSEIRSLIVFDLNGKVLTNVAADLIGKQVDLSNLTNGIYLVEFNMLNGMKVQQRIILSK